MGVLTLFPMGKVHDSFFKFQFSCNDIIINLVTVSIDGVGAPLAAPGPGVGNGRGFLG